MRQITAAVLCFLSNAIVGVMAVASGFGLFVAAIVLAVTGTISVVAAILLATLGVPVVGTVMYWIAAALALPMMGIAKLLDREYVDSWMHSQPVDDY